MAALMVRKRPSICVCCRIWRSTDLEMRSRQVGLLKSEYGRNAQGVLIPIDLGSTHMCYVSYLLCFLPVIIGITSNYRAVSPTNYIFNFTLI